MFPRFVIVISVLMLGGALAVWANSGLSAKQARELLRRLGGAELKADQVRIKTVSNGLNGNAIVEAQIETAIRFKQEKNEWGIAEIRFGDNHWESVELITEAVRREKTRRTELQMQQLVTAIENYKTEHGSYIVAETFDKMMEQLPGREVVKLLRVDYWQQPFSFQGTAKGYRLTSSGVDLKPGTNDDLIVEKQ
jgi:Type II secretion system (T2SS), protein G